jgi:hypothetical protein
MNKLKIYGERNSGTNFLTRLIRRNFQCELIPGTLAEARPGYREIIEQELETRISDMGKRILARQIRLDDFFRGNLWTTLGWKHGVPPAEVIRNYPDRDRTLFVTISKNPYAWVLSLFRRPYENTALDRMNDLSSFINEPWITGSRENTPAYLESPVELWNLKADGYQRLANVAVTVNVRYEDLLDAPMQFLQIIENYLERRTKKFELPVEPTKSDDVGHKDFDYYRDYYLNERWRKELGHEHIMAINRFLEPAIVEKSGYKIIPTMGKDR